MGRDKERQGHESCKYEPVKIYRESQTGGFIIVNIFYYISSAIID